MPRVPRVFVEGALYYVTSKGIHEQNIFNEREDYLMYLDLLSKYKEQLGFKVFSFALMPTHVHLLIETKPQTTLSGVMHNITSSYTKYYNKKYNRQGHLFRGRFRAAVIEKGPNLLKLTRYVHLNPKQLNLISGLNDYPYSSYLYYMNRGREVSPNLDLRTEVQEVLGLLGEGRRYEDFMNEDVPQETAALSKDLHRKIFLGSPEFGERVQEILKKESLKETAENPKPRVRSLVWPVVSGIVLAALATSSLIYTQRISKRARHILTEEKNPGLIANENIAFELVGLDGSIWQIKFVTGTPSQAVDTLKFKDGKMSSENLGFSGFPASNYSTTKEAGRLIWETMQTSASETASWRGEVEAGKMRGVLSLRQKEGRSQDFSFVSLKYQKIK